ncbi:MAG TPA: hypothetical protein VKR32_19800 [Puia sp.]|nr:hypothetical protein [Puia sp.]
MIFSISGMAVVDEYDIKELPKTSGIWDYVIIQQGWAAPESLLKSGG